jgi:hypothetical protein
VGEHSAVAAAAVRWEHPPHRIPERNRTIRTGDAQEQSLVGQGVVRIEDAGVEMVATVVVDPDPVADSLELGTARVVRVRAGRVCAVPALRQAHLHRHWASLSKQEERFQVLRRRLRGSEVGHRLSRVYWMIEGGRVC